MNFFKPSMTRRRLLTLATVAAGSRFYPAFAAAGDKGTTKSTTLFYRPANPGNFWDTWVYYHNGLFHLYHLWGPAEGDPRFNFDCIAMATSRDGVHWTERGRVIEPSDRADLIFIGGGSVWPIADKNGREQKFIMNFHEVWGGKKPGSSTFFAESQDLLHWKNLGKEFEFSQDSRWYKEDGSWIAMWSLPRPGGGFYGYWTAEPKAEAVGIGFGESDDGVTWRALEPAMLPDVQYPLV